MHNTAAEMMVDLSPLAADDAAYLETLTRQLRSELLDLDVRSIGFASVDEAELGAKGLGLGSLGILLIEFAGRSEVLAAIVATVRDWLDRGHSGTVKLTLGGDSIEVTGRPSPEQAALVDLWVAHHARTS